MSPDPLGRFATEVLTAVALRLVDEHAPVTSATPAARAELAEVTFRAAHVGVLVELDRAGIAPDALPDPSAAGRGAPAAALRALEVALAPATAALPATHSPAAGAALDRLVADEPEERALLTAALGAGLALGAHLASGAATGSGTGTAASTTTTTRSEPPP